MSRPRPGGAAAVSGPVVTLLIPSVQVTAPDLAVTKLVLEVDNRYSEYGRCNICGPNGTDHHGNNSCTPGAYLL